MTCRLPRAEEGTDAFAGLLADARRRRRLLTRRGGAPAIRPPQAAGIALAISGAALGVVSGVRVTQFNDWTDAQLADPELRGTPTAFAEGYRSRAWANQVLIGSAISCGVGALVTLLAGSVQRRTPVAVSAGRAQLQVQVGTTVDPGLSVGLRGRW